jgi:HlyD family secretion protein
MSASADIQTKTKLNVLSVALNAVTTRDPKSDAKKDDKKKEAPGNTTTTDKTPAPTELEEVVFVLQKDGKVKKVKVSTAIQDLTNIEITSGLKKDDEVIIGPYNVISKTLKDGDKVKVVAKDKLYDDGKKS